MLRKLVKLVAGIVGTIVALALITTASVAVWVMTGPKSLNKLVPYIEESLNASELPYMVQVDDAIFFWESWSEPVDFRLHGIKIYTDVGDELLKLREVSVGLDMDSLLHAKLVPTSVAIRNPEVHFFRDDAGEFFIGIGGEPENHVPLAMLVAGLGKAAEDEEGETAPEEETEEAAALAGSIQYVAIQNAKLTLGAPGEEALFSAPDANLMVTRSKRSINAALDFGLEHGDEVSQVHAEVKLQNHREMVTGKVEVYNFSATKLADVLPHIPEIKMLEMPFNGWADMIVESDGRLALVDFSLDGKFGTFSNDEHFAEPIKMENVHIAGQLRDNASQLVIKKADITMQGGATLSVNGLVHKVEPGVVFDIAAVAKNMPVNDLYKYWPKTLGETAYEWVTTNIREGKVPHAEARVKITEEDIGKPFPDSGLAASIQVEGANVDYLEGHPKVQNVTGEVKFTGTTMEIRSQKGEMLTGSKLESAYLKLTSLGREKPKMHIDLKVDAPANDVATYVGIPSLDYAKPLSLDAEQITGSAQGKLSFDFLLPSKTISKEEMGLKFLIEAQLKDVAQRGFLEDMNLSAVNGVLKITQDELTLNGPLALEEAPLTIELTHFFNPEDHQTEYLAKGIWQVEQFKIFNLPDMPFLTGPVGFGAAIKIKDGINYVNVSADLSQANLSVPDIGLYKPQGTQAGLKFSVDTAEGALVLKNFELKGDELYASGSAVVRDNMQVVDRIRLDRVEFSDNNLAIDVEKIDGGYKVRAKGPSLDLKPYFRLREEGDERSFVQFPFILDVHGEFDWVVIAKERELRMVNAKFMCNPDWCEAASVKGITGQDNAFKFEVAPKDGIRQVAFTASNAGSFLKALDVFDGMVGGQLSVFGTFDDKAPGRPFIGQLSITENTITNAPVLAKIASLMSLTGLADTLTGKGISFDKIEGNIMLTDTAFVMENGKAVGPALGLTVDKGSMVRATEIVDVRGTIVPSYTLNTVLDNIPVLGAALTAGGEGMFAATYGISGKYPDNVDVDINPLTMLAPGFLRNLVGG